MSLHSQIPEKPRRKRLEVPVHKTIQEQPTKEKVHKTFSANFSSKRYRHKTDKSEELLTDDTRKSEVRDVNSGEKISKKQLKKEHARMLKENQQLVTKFDQLEDLSAAKIIKLREKISVLGKLNAEISDENSGLREQYQCLLNNYELLKHEYELMKICNSCKELQQSLDACVLENNLLRNKNAELCEDVKMLKTVVYRLNLQMERYQEKLRRFDLKPCNSLRTLQQPVEDLQDHDNVITTISEHHIDHSHTPVAWGNVNSHTLGPLLDAYQDTIAEKEEIILSYENELSKFTGKLKAVIKENELLHIKLTEDDECGSKLRIRLENVNKELRAVREHNDVLIKKCAIKQDKIEEILRCYESKVEQLQRDYNIVHEQYYQSRSEISTLKEKNRALVDAQDDFKNERHNYIPISVHTASVNECKKWYEELKLQYEAEKKKLKDNLEYQNKLIEELNAKIKFLESEKEECGNKIKQLKELLRKAEAKHLDTEHSLHESQLSRTACRKQLNKAMAFAKELVAEQEALLKILNERQKENRAVKRIGSEIATRMDSLKSQLKTVQKDAWQELTTVEQRIEEQNNIIEAMKKDHEQELEKLKVIIRQQEESNLLLKGQSSIPLPHYLLFRDKSK